MTDFKFLRRIEVYNELFYQFQKSLLLFLTNTKKMKRFN